MQGRAEGCYIVGCGGGEEQSKKDGDKITMGFSQIGAESEWRTANTESVKQAAKDAGIELQFSDAQQKQENQIKAIRSFIAQGVDVIAFVPIVETGWDTVLKEAKDAKIPVIIVDRDLKVEDGSLYVAKIGTNMLTEGQKGFEWLAKYANEKQLKPRDGGNKLNIVVLEGTVGSTAALGRTKGFNDAMAASPDQDKFNILASQAIEAAGLKPGKDITILSFDGVKGIFQAMIEGKSNCTVECNPLQGELLMETAKKILKGEKVDKIVYVDEGVFPADVAEKTLPSRKY